MEAQLQIMSTTARFDPAPIFFIVLGIVLITVGMAVGLGKIGDAMVMNNPDAATSTILQTSPQQPATPV